MERVACFVLVHSPSVGPSTWRQVSDQLRQGGHETVVPSLLGVADGGPPYWAAVATAVRGGLSGRDIRQPVVLVAHSNAGLFVPVIASELRGSVVCSIFADASIPPSSGSTPVAEDEFLPFLRDLVDENGRLPQWTNWWSDEDVAPMLPDPPLRQVITAEQPRLPLEYYLEQIPVPAGWDDQPCGYLLFSQAYEGQADEARRRGWPVRTTRGEHLHQAVDPEAVTQALLELAGEASGQS
ncbi:MAG: alpha/beta fold hydrolase [Streptosporangiaceae bacterium]